MSKLKLICKKNTDFIAELKIQKLLLEADILLKNSRWTAKAIKFDRYGATKSYSFNS
ncbi:MAG: hypothetical protein HC785_09310 [Calothrix sp. CSU_2_0]|nr:hypothetical protein [Calothrix sp. CSU_2_0]